MRSIPKNITKEFIEILYVKEEKSLREIGNLVKKSQVQVSRYLKKFNIKARPFSTKGRSSWNKGVPMKKESKEKLSKAHLGKKLSKEHRDKVVKSLKYGIKGKGNNNWKGGKYINPSGYVYLKSYNHPNKMSNGYFSEHRLVMEKKLGRYLGKFEHIHHINGIKDDNRIENLELINAQTHNLITMMEIRIKELEKENEILREKRV